MKRLLIAILFLLFLTAHVFAAASRTFDDTNDDIDMGNTNDITTETCSGCIWQKITADTTADFALGKKSDALVGTLGYGLLMTSAERPWSVVSDGTTLQSAASVDTLSGWHFICFTWNSSLDDLWTYYDGATTASDTAGTLGSITNAVNFKIGEAGAADTINFNGLLAYGQFWNGEVIGIIKQPDAMWQPGIMQGDAGGSLVGFWTLWGDSPEPDYKGTNDGTVSGSGVSTDGPPVYFGMGLPL